jgi:hypothetical protein
MYWLCSKQNCLLCAYEHDFGDNSKITIVKIGLTTKKYVIVLSVSNLVSDFVKCNHPIATQQCLANLLNPHLDAARVALERVDVLHAVAAAVVELADGDVAGVVADKDVAGALVVHHAGAPRAAQVAAQAAAAGSAVKLKIPENEEEHGNINKNEHQLQKGSEVKMSRTFEPLTV